MKANNRPTKLFHKAAVFLSFLPLLGGCHYPESFILGGSPRSVRVYFSFMGSRKPFRLEDGLRIGVGIGVRDAYYALPEPGFRPFGFSLFLDCSTLGTPDTPDRYYFLDFFTPSEFLGPMMGVPDRGVFPFERDYLVDGDWIATYSDYESGYFLLSPKMWAIGKGKDGNILTSSLRTQNPKAHFVRSASGLFHYEGP